MATSLAFQVVFCSLLLAVAFVGPRVVVLAADLSHVRDEVFREMEAAMEAELTRAGDQSVSNDQLHVSRRSRKINILKEEDFESSFQITEEVQKNPGFIPMGAPPHLFVRYSVYRTSKSSFSVVGLASSSQLEDLHSDIFKECVWVPVWSGSHLEVGNNLSNFSKVVGTAQMRSARLSHKHTYEAVVVNCSFDGTETGTEVETAGALFLQPAALHLTRLAGMRNKGLRTFVHLPMLVFVERKFNGKKFKIRYDNDGKSLFKIEYAHCGPPLHQKLLAKQVGEWYSYHYELLEKNVHFFVYNVGGLNSAVRQVLSPFITAGAVTITNALQQENFDSYYFSQSLFLIDCQNRALFFAKWIFNFDGDEYLVIRPPSTLSSFLYINNTETYGVSFGTVMYPIHYCVKSKSSKSWLVENTVYRRVNPVCIAKYIRKRLQDPHTCPDSFGRRKWMVNPRMVSVVRVHDVKWIPFLKNTLRPILSTENIWLGHFRGILLPQERKACQSIVDSLPPKVISEYKLKIRRKYVLDLHIREIAQKLRRRRI